VILRVASVRAAAAETQLNGTTSVPINVDANGQFLALVQDEAGTPQPNVDVYLQTDAADASTATDRSDTDGLASVKTAPGRYQLDVAARYRIVSVAETRDQGALINAITIAARDPLLSKAQAFLHEITIEANDVSMMGLSGIGFALKAGAVLTSPNVAVPTNNAKGALLTYIDAALLNLALTPLLRATHPVRDLVIVNNRLHHNLRNPFTEEMLAQAQQIGRGGVSLAVVDSAVVSDNHINDNGVDAINPACGVFVGWGNDVEITDNTLAANGAITAGFEENRKAGLRGGLYVRFAGAMTSQLSKSTGRKPALRVHDNRVDQPAGRALTAFAFGPVSIANNHFSSQFTGRFGFLDTAFGSVLVGNLGGVHRLIARLFGNRITDTPAFASRAEASLPGGETLFDDNFVRLDAVNRSITSQAILCLDDLGYASNTSSVYRGDPFFCNTVLVGDTVRAVGCRMREDALRTLSMLTIALRANITAHNQADHCIFARPPATGGSLPRTVDTPNHIFDSTFCRDAAGNPTRLGVFAASALAAHAAQLGGTIDADAFSDVEVNDLARTYAMTSISRVNTTQIAMTRAYQTEAVRLGQKLGLTHPTVEALNAQAEAGIVTQQLLNVSAEAGAAPAPTVPDSGSVVSGRLANVKGQGQGGYTVVLVNARGAQAETLGRTDGNGLFSASFDAQETAGLAKLGKLRPRVLDANDKEVLLSDNAVVVAPGARVEITLTIPVRVVPRSVLVDGTVIFPRPTTGSGPSPRTPLAKLDIDAATQKQFITAGIIDVEGVVEAGEATVAKILGNREEAATLIERAKRVLNVTPDPSPSSAVSPRAVSPARTTPKKRKK